MATSPPCPRCGSRTLAKDLDFRLRLVPSCLACGWQDTPSSAENRRFYDQQLPLIRNVGHIRA